MDVEIDPRLEVPVTSPSRRRRRRFLKHVINAAIIIPVIFLFTTACIVSVGYMSLKIRFAGYRQSNSPSYSSGSPTPYINNATKDNHHLPRLPVNRIVGGSRVIDDKYNYTVAIFEKTKTQSSFVLTQMCGGTLVTPNMILSAAHCSHNAHVVQIGRRHIYDPTETFETFDIIRIENHPHFDHKSYANDFALYQFTGESQFHNIKLDSGEYRSLKERDRATVMGWGDIEFKGPASVMMMEVVVMIMSQEECRARYGAGKRLGPYTICASDDQKDSCEGDSGGPLVMHEADEDVQIGIVSWGVDCALPSFPGVYARVSEEFEWIAGMVCNMTEGVYCGDYLKAPSPEIEGGGRNQTENGEECEDEVNFVAVDKRKGKRKTLNCEWVRLNSECDSYKQFCRETCGVCQKPV